MRNNMKNGFLGRMGIKVKTDLFGNSITEAAQTDMRRIVSRAAPVSGRDLYTTEPADIERFLGAAERDGLEIPGPVWEPAAGLGDISKTLMRHGYEVRSSDIFPYKDGEIEIAARDFFLCGATDCMSIFTNPPFNAHEKFLEHALSFGVVTVFLVRLSFLTGKRRLKIYERFNPAFVYVYSGRATCYKGGSTDMAQSMVDYCVMVWIPPYRGSTVLRWIP
jgi:hypothetical protein